MIASFKMDEAYYRESLNEWLSSVSKGRRLEPHLFELFLLLGIALLIMFPHYKISGIAALLFAAYELIKRMRFKRRWMKERIGSSAYGREMIVELKKGDINLINSETDQVRLSLLKTKVIVSRKGLFICPEERIHLYVPFRSFSPPISRADAIGFMQASRGARPDEAGARA